MLVLTVLFSTTKANPHFFLCQRNGWEKCWKRILQRLWAFPSHNILTTPCKFWFSWDGRKKWNKKWDSIWSLLNRERRKILSISLVFSSARKMKMQKCWCHMDTSITFHAKLTFGLRVEGKNCHGISMRWQLQVDKLFWENNRFSKESIFCDENEKKFQAKNQFAY